MVTYINHESKAFGVNNASHRLMSLIVNSGVSVDFQRAFKSRFGSRNFDEMIITALNADLLAFEMALWPREMKWQSYHIGFWSWELESFPGALKPALGLVNEVWTVSEHAANGIRGSSDQTVRKVLLPVPAQPIREKRASSKFTFLTAFDFQSDINRKNPGAAIRAYIQAFPNNSQTQLIVKSTNHQAFGKQLAELRKLADFRSDVIFITEVLPEGAYKQLLSKADCFISLHRAEGFGLNLADSMGLGIPVIATGYSGNLEYMDETNSLLIPYEMSEVDSYAGFRVQSRWAEPNIEAAANAMALIAGDEKIYSNISNRARKKIENNFSLEATVRKFVREFCE